MTDRYCDILVTSGDHQRIMDHLFPGDKDEHGAILRAGIVRNGSSLRLLIQHVQPADFGIDYVAGRHGYRALTPTFIHREILQCRDAGLAYLAIHSHGSDRHVEFSKVDLESHERGYPALLDIGRGIPVGALVYGRNSVAADIWLPDGSRRKLGTYRVIGSDITRLYSQPWQEREAKHRTRSPGAYVGGGWTADPASEQGRCRRTRRRRVTSNGVPRPTWRWEPRSY